MRASEGNILNLVFISLPPCRERAVCFKLICKVCYSPPAQKKISQQNRFVSSWVTSFAESLPKSSVFRSHFCEIQLFATCLFLFLSAGISAQRAILELEDKKWVLVSSCNAHILFDTPPPQFHTTAAFVLGKSWNKLFQDLGPFHIYVQSFDISVSIPFFGF